PTTPTLSLHDALPIYQPDLVYRTEREKFAAIIEEIKEKHTKGQPALVGTISIEKSELLASMLKRQGVPHVVLNAKHHEREAEIVDRKSTRLNSSHVSI